MLPDTSAEHVDRDNRCDDNDDLRGRLGVLEAADAFVKCLTDSPSPPRCRASLRSALMFVVAVGLGPFACVVAISFTISVCSKLFAEAVGSITRVARSRIRRRDAAVELAHALPARDQCNSPPPSPPSAQILFHAGRRRLGIGAAAA